MRYFLELSYKGTQYHGWQMQPNAHTVQAELNAALQTLLRQPIETTGSGRTDTGVHARQQFVHFDLEKNIADLPRFILRINALLPADIAVGTVFPVSDTAHARFDAISRTYEYHITRRRNPFLTETAYFFPHPLDVKAMNQATFQLLDFQDFEAFSKVHTEVHTFQCQLTEAYWEEKEDLLIFHISADRFLRNMVRAIVGTLLEIGTGKMPVSHLESIIHSRDRKQAGRSVPPEGLFLTKVQYVNNGLTE
jgi:tRNA pseudouridine38-40 synthase